MDGGMTCLRHAKSRFVLPPALTLCSEDLNTKARQVGTDFSHVCSFLSRPMDSGLSGKRVLVTGASGGIGAACCGAFAAEGSEIVAHYHLGHDRAEALAAELGGAVRLVQADLTDESEAGRLFTEAGPLDVWAGGAGGWQRGGL